MNERIRGAQNASATVESFEDEAEREKTALGQESKTEPRSVPRSASTTIRPYVSEESFSLVPIICSSFFFLVFSRAAATGEMYLGRLVCAFLVSGSRWRSPSRFAEGEGAFPVFSGTISAPRGMSEWYGVERSLVSKGKSSRVLVWCHDTLLVCAAHSYLSSSNTIFVHNDHICTQKRLR
jgi:hypothetical protein